jgi:hypothetical protein
MLCLHVHTQQQRLTSSPATLSHAGDSPFETSVRSTIKRVHMHARTLAPKTELVEL